MTRRQGLHAAALSLILMTTVPTLALLCRGHSPSRFASANLPFWERTPPHPAPVRVAWRCPPTPPGAVQFPDGGLVRRLLAADPDGLLFAMEHPSPRRPSPTGAGKAGQWLQAACALGRSDARLRQAQDQIAQRLMTAQDADGYLAAGTKAGRWKPAQIAAYGQNLRGLLAYYESSHSPAAIYMAMRAGDLLVAQFPKGTTPSHTTDGLLLPMAALYQKTGEPQYRNWAARLADAPGCADGPGLCALYAATGQARFLHRARRLWRQQTARRQPDAQLAAALWTLTGAPGCAAVMAAGASPWADPLGYGSLVVTRMPRGLSINVPVSARVAVGSVRLTQRLLPSAKPQTSSETLTIQVPRPTAFTLRVRSPEGDAPPGQSVLLDGKPAPVKSQNGFVTVTRRWKNGDTLVVPASGGNGG